MTQRTHRLRTAARQLHRIRLWALTGDPWMADRWPTCDQGCNGCEECTDDDDDGMPDDVCLHCHGDGMDPYCGYLLPCPDCGAAHY